MLRDSLKGRMWGKGEKSAYSKHLYVPSTEVGTSHISFHLIFTETCKIDVIIILI